MSTYVISDIHGYYNYLIEMLELIKFNNKDTLYILGDMIDRGPNGIKVIQYLKDKENIKVLKGNHEDMMCLAFSHDIKYRINWYRNGGVPTENEFLKLKKQEQKEILKYLENLPLYFEITVNNIDYILVHAGVHPTFIKKNIPMSKHRADDLLWIRDLYLYNKIETDKIIISGHTRNTSINGDYHIIYKDNKILIDCGVIETDLFNQGRLGCLRLDDLKEFYV